MVKNAVERIKGVIDFLNNDKVDKVSITHSKAKSSSSHKSQMKAEETNTRLNVAVKTPEIKKAMAELKLREESLNAELQIAKHKEELDLAETRVRYELEGSDVSVRSDIIINVPVISPNEKTELRVYREPHH
jgi:hypothetical protein